MRGVLRRHLVSAVCLAAAALIGIAAVADHRAKQTRLNRVEVSEWYCVHRGTRCDGPSSARIEAHWNERQLGYEIAVVLLAGAAVARVAALEARRRR